ncbi:hypothetical protein ACTD5D_41170 [Nocardia takedensis]|uniref:hypothetical protein n=1 Tax=Nocardia takedensis TaxID=259390 RepID=UPI003F77552B
MSGDLMPRVDRGALLFDPEPPRSASPIWLEQPDSGPDQERLLADLAEDMRASAAQAGDQAPTGPARIFAYDREVLAAELDGFELEEWE